MIIECPNCNTRYRLALSIIGLGRTVRCTQCQYEWMCHPADDMTDILREELKTQESRVDSDNQFPLSVRRKKSKIRRIEDNVFFRILTSLSVVFMLYTVVFYHSEIFFIPEKVMKYIDIYNTQNIEIASVSSKILGVDGAQNKKMLINAVIENNSPTIKQFPIVHVTILNRQFDKIFEKIFNPSSQNTYISGSNITGYSKQTLSINLDTVPRNAEYISIDIGNAQEIDIISY